MTVADLVPWLVGAFVCLGVGLLVAALLSESARARRRAADAADREMAWPAEIGFDPDRAQQP